MWKENEFSLPLELSNLLPHLFPVAWSLSRLRRLLGNPLSSVRIKKNEELINLTRTNWLLKWFHEREISAPRNLGLIFAVLVSGSENLAKVLASYTI